MMQRIVSMSDEEKAALVEEIMSEDVGTDVETAEDMLFDLVKEQEDADESVDPEMKAMFDSIPDFDALLKDDIEGKVSAGLGQADPRVQGLIKYWTTGEGGVAKVRWGTPGDGKRCIRHMTKYIGANRAPGFCQTLHKRMVGGRVMGQGPGESRKSDEMVTLEFKDVSDLLASVGMTTDEVIFDPEKKVIRHVRTPEGQRRYKRPIGSVITGSGNTLKHVLEVSSDFDGWNAYKVKGRKEKTYVGKYQGKWVVADHEDNVLHDATSEEDALKWLDGEGAKRSGSNRGTFAQGPNSANSSNAGAPKKKFSEMSPTEKRKALKPGMKITLKSADGDYEVEVVAAPRGTSSRLVVKGGPVTSGMQRTINISAIRDIKVK